MVHLLRTANLLSFPLYRLVILFRFICNIILSISLMFILVPPWRGVRYLSLGSSSMRTVWDPTVSLELNHPALVLLEKCSTRNQFNQILGQVMRSNLIGQTFPMSRLIVFCAVSHPENLGMAKILFNHFTPHPNLYIYNTMLSALSFSTSQSFSLYNLMLHTSVHPDKHTVLYLLRASKCISEAKQIHCQATVTGMLPHGYLQNSLIKKYMESGNLRLALQVLQCMSIPDSVSFNILIGGYAKKGYGEEAIQLFRKMICLGLQPDEFTTLGLLLSCGPSGNVLPGRSIHAWIQRRKFVCSSNLILGNALLDMYLKCKELKLAQRLFDKLVDKDSFSWNTIVSGFAKAGEMELACSYFNKMPNRDLVAWNCLITGYNHQGDYMMVVNLINSMIAENTRPDSITMVNFISAMAEIGLLDQGKLAHGWIIRMQMNIDVFIGSALIDMYCKCGNIERALQVFRRLDVKDTIVWTTMITGFAFHGFGLKALHLFAEMKDVLPNEVTFLSILTACTHSGLVDQGIKAFHDMKQVYGIEPTVEHYGCLVDLLGRSGRLNEAKDLIDKMPMEPSQSVWGTMLNACRAHRNTTMAELALTELLKLEPDEEGGYILLSNIYAASGRWTYADKIRCNMESKGVKKTVGFSSLIVDGVVHHFVASDKQISRWEEINHILNFLKDELKVRGEFISDFPLRFLHPSHSA